MYYQDKYGACWEESEIKQLSTSKIKELELYEHPFYGEEIPDA